MHVRRTRRIVARLAVIGVLTAAAAVVGSGSAAGDVIPVPGWDLPVTPVDLVDDPTDWDDLAFSPTMLVATGRPWTGFAVIVDGPDHPDDGRIGAEYSNCRRPLVPMATDEIVCVFPDTVAADGDVLRFSDATPVSLVVDGAAAYPGPIDLCSIGRVEGGDGCRYGAYAIVPDDVDRIMRTTSPMGDEPALLETVADPGEWTRDGAMTVTTAPRTASLAARPQNLVGVVGEERTLRVEIVNSGEADWPRPDPREGSGGLRVVVPSGVEVVDPGDHCASVAGREYVCDIRDVDSGDNCFHSMTVRITDAEPHTDGSITAVTAPGPNAWYDVDLDPDHGDDTAAITVNAADPGWPPRESCA